MKITAEIRRIIENLHQSLEVNPFYLLCISKIAEKFSGFLSKKYSGGSPGTNSSQSDKIPEHASIQLLFQFELFFLYLPEIVADLMSFPNLVVGYLSSEFLWAINLSPPTSRITHCDASFKKSTRNEIWILLFIFFGGLAILDFLSLPLIGSLSACCGVWAFILPKKNFPVLPAKFKKFKTFGWHPIMPSLHASLNANFLMMGYWI